MTLPFDVFRDPRAMRAKAEDLRRDGRRIAVVPTMGALHDGHLALLRAARGTADVVILTIFVNPTQFGPGEDLANYPRDEAGDLARARSVGIDLAFCPEAAAMYRPGSQTFVEVRELQKPLCGASRPGHFAGVATVVTKLFHITQPHVAVFGEKDYQQLAIIRRMARDLDFAVEIASVPIVREADGVAMSSRNRYLSTEQRRAAALVAAARAPIEAEADTRIDYAELRDAEELTAITHVERPAVLALAVFVGTTRLIDNRVLG